MSSATTAGSEEHSAQAVIDGLIEEWQLQPHPEGGWYREVHRSDQQVTRADGAIRPGFTTILFLLDRASISQWHRVRDADEVWIHLQGSPLSLWDLPEAGGTAVHRMLSLQQPIQVIPANHWQAAQPQGPYCLVSCCVGPGFDFDDFTLLRDLPEGEWPNGVIQDLV